MNPPNFEIGGVVLAIVPGRNIPGSPSRHVINAKTEEHISLAFPEGEKAVLFDLREGRGYRYHYDTGEVQAIKKQEYYKARERAGWPIRRRAKAAV
jgi:hypothetical protein